MLGMRWKALDRAVNLSQVPAQGDAAFQALLRGKIPKSETLGPDMRNYVIERSQAIEG